MRRKQKVTWIPPRLFIALFIIAANSIVCKAQFDYVIDVCSDAAFVENLPDGEIKGVIVTSNRLTGQENYTLDERCPLTTLTLEYPSGGSVIFNFLIFDVEYDASCQYDYFSINNDKYCGFLPSKTVCYGGQDSVDFQWVSDDLFAWTGFVIQFTTYNTNECDCLADEPNNGERKSCVFPFILDGTTHYQCATTPSDSIAESEPYCATSVDASQNLQTYGMCDETIKACERHCRTTTGDQCLFPWSINEVEYNGCVPNQKDGSFGCTTLMGRDISGFSDDIEIYGQGSCDLSACDVVLTCDGSSPVQSGQIIPFAGYNDGSYPLNLQCSVDLENADYQSFFVTLNSLSLMCEDSLEFLDAKDPNNVLRFCGDTKGTDYESFSFCWKNFVNSSDYSMDIEFTSGSAPKNQRTGYLIEFQATDSTAECPPSSENDLACTDVAGQQISSDYDIYSYNYPYPYPTGLSCRWNIESDSARLSSFPVILVKSIDLGIPWNDISASVNEIDTLTIVDSSGTERILTPSNATANMSVPIILAEKTGSIQFNSAPYFNFHQTFHISVEYLDPSSDPDVFEAAGFCLSADNSALCHFPFTVDGQEYDTCWKFPGDDQASCQTIDEAKVFCDMSFPKCRPGIPNFSITGVQHTESSVTVIWEVDNDDPNWDYFRIFLNNQRMTPDATQLSYTVDTGSSGETNVLEIQIVSYSVLGTKKAVSFQSSDSSAIFVLERTETTMNIQWDPVESADSYRLDVEIVFVNSITQKLLENNPEVNSFDFSSEIIDKEVLIYTLGGLHAGMSYNLTVSALDGSGNPLVSYSSVKSTKPGELNKETNNFEITTDTDGNFILNGKVTPETSFSSLSVTVQKNTENVQAANRVRRSTNTDDTGSLEIVASSSQSIDDFVDDDFTFAVEDLGNSEPGTLYEFQITPFTGQLPGDTLSVTYLTDPDPPSGLQAVDVTTSSFTLTWAAPENGQYSSFLLQLTCDDSCTILLNREIQITTTEYAVTRRVGAGDTYSAIVTTQSYETTTSETVQLVFDAQPEPVMEFSALAFKDDLRVVSLQFLPPRSTWHSFNIYSWELDRDGIVIDTDEPITFDTDLTFPMVSTEGSDEFDIKYRSFGTLYEAIVRTVSANGRESDNRTIAFVTGLSPLPADALTVVDMDDYILTTRWIQSRANSNFNRFSVTVINQDTGSELSSAEFDVSDTAETGLFAEMSIAQNDVPHVENYEVQVVTISQYDTAEFQFVKKSTESSFTIPIIRPDIQSFTSTLTSLQANVDISAYGDSSTFVAELRVVDTGEFVINKTFQSSGCEADLTNCQIEFISLEYETNYSVKIYVVETNFNYRVSSYRSDLRTASLPTDFRLVENTTTSYSFDLVFENLPFGDDPTITSYSIILAEPSSSTNFRTDNIIGEKYWSDYIEENPPYQATQPLPYKMDVDNDNRWPAQLGIEECDRTEHVICNGPLKPHMSYNLWIVGVTEESHAILQRQISGLQTDSDGIADVDITEVGLSFFRAQFTPTLPDSATYEIVVSETDTGAVVSSQTIIGTSCNSDCLFNVTNLLPDTDYSLTITPTYSGFERSSETITVSSSLLPDNVNVSPDFTLDNPTTSFKIKVQGFPFGTDELVTDYTIIVASGDYNSPVTQIPDNFYNDVNMDGTTPIEPYLPLGANLSYPPAVEADGITFYIEVGTDANCTSGGACNGELPQNTDFKIWFATTPTESNLPIFRGPYAGFQTLRTVTELTELGRTLTSFIIGVPVSDTASLTVNISDSSGQVVQSISGVDPAFCNQGGDLGFCVISVADLNPNTEYTVQTFNESDNNADVELITITTNSLPTISVTQPTDEVDDPYTKIQLSIEGGLPFGQDASIAQYALIVSSTEESDTIQYPASTWAEVSDGIWTAYQPRQVGSYSTLRSDFASIDQWTLEIGSVFPCQSSAIHCNGPLEPGKSYTVAFAGITDAGHVILTELFQTFTTSPIEVTLDVTTGLTHIRSEFNRLITDSIEYRIEVSSDPADILGRIHTQTVTSSECDSESFECVDTAPDITASPPNYKVCLFVLYRNYPDSAHSCISVTIQKPQEAYPDFTVVPGSLPENVYTQVLLAMQGLPFGVDPEITTYSVILSSTEHDSTDDMESTDQNYAGARESDWIPYIILEPLSYPPDGTSNLEFSWNVIAGSQHPCPDQTQYCNGALDPGLELSVMVRGYTESGFHVSSRLFTGFTTQSGELDADITWGLRSVEVELTIDDSFPSEDTTFQVSVTNKDSGESNSISFPATSVCTAGVCTMLINNLTPGHNYSISITPTVDGVALLTINQDFTTDMLPDILVQQVLDSTAVSNPATQLELKITGLPFGDDKWVLQYSILTVVDTNETDTNVVYPDSVVPYQIAQQTDEVYQLFPMEQYPPSTTTALESHVWYYVMGATGQCGQRQCNGPLNPDTNYTVWFVGRLGSGQSNDYILTQSFSGFYTLPLVTEPPINAQETDFQPASLSPVFFVIGIIALLLLLLFAFICIRRRNKVRIYPFLKYFSPKPRQTLYAYEHYSLDESSESGSSQILHKPTHQTTVNTGPDVVDHKGTHYPPLPKGIYKTNVPLPPMAPLAPFGSKISQQSPVTMSPVYFPPKPTKPPQKLKLPPGFRATLGLSMASPFEPPKDEMDANATNPGAHQDPEEEEEVLVARKPAKVKEQSGEISMDSPTAYIDLASKFS